MESTHCANCSRELAPDFNVCPQCGQKTRIHRFTIPHFLHELLHAFTHADKGALFLLKELIVKPGVVLHEYIVEGKRKKYFNPFTLLLIVLGFSVFMNSILHPFQKAQYITSERIASAKTQQQKAIFQRMTVKQAEINEFMEKKTNIMTFVTAPFIALGFWLVFKGKRLNYAEHLVAYLMLTSVLSLLSTVSFVPLMAKLPPDKFSIIAGANLLVQIIYTSFAYSKFLQLKGIGEVFMVAVANILGFVFSVALMMVATIIYFLVS